MKVKEHLEKHKAKYAFVGGGVLFAGITVLVMRSNAALGGASEGSALGGVSNTASLLFSNRNTINITTVLEREGRGHPGWPVRNLETKRVFFSQREAAMAFDIPEGRLSGHLKGMYPDVDGLHFQRINLQES